MTRPAFDYRALIVEWRARCRQEGLDPRTGCPLEMEAVYRLDDRGRRVIARIPVLPDPPPEPLCDPASVTWWVQPDLFAEIGDNHSTVEAEAFANIAAEVRRIAGVPEPETVADAVRAIWQEDGERRERQIAMPLRELHAKRGEIVELIVGVRMLVPVKVA